MSISMERALDLVVLNLFLVIGCLLKAYQPFLIAHQQVSGRHPASKIFPSVPFSFLVRAYSIFLFVLFGFMLFFNDFGCSELMLRKVWRSVFSLNILVCNLFLIYISVSRSSFFRDACFIFDSFKYIIYIYIYIYVYVDII